MTGKDTRRRVLIVGAGPAQAAGIRSARERGLITVAVDRNPEAVGFRDADTPRTVDIKDVDAVVRVAREEAVDLALAFCSDIALVTVGAVNEALDLPGIRPPMVRRATNKLEMRLAHRAAGVPIPEFAVVRSSDEIDAALALVGLPAVVKPADSSGSRGVRFIESAPEAQPAFSRAIGFSTEGSALFESYFPGKEVAVDGFMIAGTFHALCVSDKVRTPAPFLLDEQVIFPSWRQPAQVDRIKTIAEAAVRALDLDNCPIHMELLVNGDDAVVVEVAARGAGFKVFTEILPRITGVDLVGLQLDLALGAEVSPPPAVVGQSACLRFFAGRDGVLESIEGVPEAESLDGVDEIEFYVGPGDRTSALTSGSDRLGHVISYGQTPLEAQRIAAEAAARIRLNYADAADSEALAR